MYRGKPTLSFSRPNLLLSGALCTLPLLLLCSLHSKHHSTTKHQTQLEAMRFDAFFDLTVEVLKWLLNQISQTNGPEGSRQGRSDGAYYIHSLCSRSLLLVFTCMLTVATFAKRRLVARLLCNSPFLLLLMGRAVLVWHAQFVERNTLLTTLGRPPTIDVSGELPTVRSPLRIKALRTLLKTG